MTDVKLKPCPFCGGEPSLIPHIGNKTYEVRCLSDKCYEGCALDTVDEAAKHWNTRVTDSVEAEIESLKKALRNYLEKHNKESETRYFLKEGRIEKDTIVECDCECCEVGRVLLNGHNTRS